MMQDDLFSLFLAKLGDAGVEADLPAGLIQHLVRSMLPPAALATHRAKQLLVSCLSMLGHHLAPSAEQAAAEDLQSMTVQVKF